MRARLGDYATLGGLAAASAVVAGLTFWLPYPLARWWQRPLLDYAWFTDYTLDGQALFYGAFGLLFALHYAALAYVRHQPHSGPVWLILLGQIGLGVPFLAMYPVAANDVYDYLLYGRLAVYWGVNPLAHAPSAVPDEPLLGYSYWPDEPSVYGPLWQAASEWLTRAVDGQVLEGLIAFKLLAFAASLAATGLVWLTLRHLRPAWAPAGALAFGWNPFLHFEAAGNAHNDMLMVAFLALAFWLLARGWPMQALPAFAASLLVKVTAAPLAPVLALATLLGDAPWRVRVGRLLVGSGVALLVVLAFYAPYWEGRASLPFLDRGNWFTASPATLLRQYFREWQTFEAAGRTAATIAGALFALASAALLGSYALRTWRADPSTLAAATIRTAYHVFFAYLVLAALWWQPWYLLVLLLLGALSADQRLLDRANLFAVGGLLSYAVFKYVWTLYQEPWQLDYTRIMALSVAVIFTPPLLHLLLSALDRRHNHRPGAAAGADGSAKVRR